MEDAFGADLGITQQHVDQSDLQQIDWVIQPMTKAIWWQHTLGTERKQAGPSMRTKLSSAGQSMC
jgi:O-acetylhomoserine/O-acetylserine sulfhydrylase-like pyridoxal-dependent enzyme